MKLSANQAAKEAHKTKKTILDAIKTKRMSASKNDKGHWEIDASELFRVFPKTADTPVSNTEAIPPEKPHNTSALEVELKFVHEKLADKDALIEELRSQRDKWQVQAERLLLERPTPQTIVTPTNQNQPEGQGGKRRFFGLLGRA